MGMMIVKQPNDNYAIWSSVVDNFVAINLLAIGVIDYMVADYRQYMEGHVKETIEQLDCGEKPYMQFTKSFKECLAEIRKVHGKDNAVLKRLEKLGIK